MRKRLTTEERTALYLDVAEHLYRDMGQKDLAKKYGVSTANVQVMASDLRREGIAIPSGRGFMRSVRKNGLHIALKMLKERGTVLMPQALVQGVRKLVVNA